MSTLIEKRRRAHTGLVPTPKRAVTTGTELDYDAVLDANLAGAVATFTDLSGTLAGTLSEIRIRSSETLDTVLVRVHGRAPGSVDTVNLGWVTVPVSAQDVGRAPAEPALRDAAKTLGIKLTEACAAADISWRTFQSWNAETRPRVASQGHLWQLVHLAEDLVALLDNNVAEWVAANPRARQAIVHGQFTEAMNELISDRARRGTYRDTSTEVTALPASAVGGENIVELKAPLDRPRRTPPLRRSGSRKIKRGAEDQ